MNPSTGGKDPELELTFSDLVQLVRKEYSHERHDIGYAEGAAIVDSAIKPQIIESLSGARARLRAYYPRRTPEEILTEQIDELANGEST